MIVRTLLDTDLYKFTTSYAYIKLFPYAMGKFSFHDRNETEYTEEFLERLKNEIDKLSRLRLTEEELEYMTRNSGSFREFIGNGCHLSAFIRIKSRYIWTKHIIFTSKSVISSIKLPCMKYLYLPLYPK